MTRMLVVVLIGLTLVTGGASAADNGLITRASAYPVSETVDRLEVVLRSSGMTIFARLDHQAEAQKVGLAMRPATLVVFGNPKGGTPLMQATPTAAIDLPLKALIWEDAAGRVHLSYNAAGYLGSRHGIRGIDEALAALEKALDALTSKALQ